MKFGGNQGRENWGGSRAEGMVVGFNQNMLYACAKFSSNKKRNKKQRIQPIN